MSARWRVVVGGERKKLKGKMQNEEERCAGGTREEEGMEHSAARLEGESALRAGVWPLTIDAEGMVILLSPNITDV